MTVPLPPLPGLGIEVMPGGRSVVDVLVDDHFLIDTLCGVLMDAASSRDASSRDASSRDAPSRDRRRGIAQVLTATVARHVSAEEQYVYPAVRRLLADGDDLADQEIARDAFVLRDLRRLTTLEPDDRAFDRLGGRIARELRRHARTATGTLLPALRAMATPADLVRLGNRVQIAREAAPTRPHPGTPSTPPWNKVVDPAVGVLDRMRDLVTGRPTRINDL